MQTFPPCPQQVLHGAAPLTPGRLLLHLLTDAVGNSPCKRTFYFLGRKPFKMEKNSLIYQHRMPHMDYIYICVCVCISWCQIGLTPAVHAQNQCAKYELLHTRKSFDCSFYDNSIKMDRIYIHYLYKLHISFFFPLPPETGILKTSEAD